MLQLQGYSNIPFFPLNGQKFRIFQRDGLRGQFLCCLHGLSHGDFGFLNTSLDT